MVEKFSGKVTKASDLTIREFADFIRREISLFVEARTKNCLECDHFDEATQECRIARKVPPPKIAVKGCEMYEEKIPF